METTSGLAVFHNEVEIEDFQRDEDSETYFCLHFVWPCGLAALVITAIYYKDQFICGETVPAPPPTKN
uniref:Uncharacterized protein n=1 Tax=Catagonus wagneri TaxID=51154 RepID=A0A8C3WDC7_9CETA